MKNINKKQPIVAGIKLGVLATLVALAPASAAYERITYDNIEAGNTFEPATVKVFETNKDEKKKFEEVVTDEEFSGGDASNGVVIDLDATVAKQRQHIEGIGGAMTESTTSQIYLLEHLNGDSTKLNEVMDEIFGPDGSHFSMVRVSVASCDFSLTPYVYANQEDLSDFTIERDMEVTVPALVKARDYFSKGSEDPEEFKILASPWTAPPWMKDGTGAKNGYAGGRLQDKYYQTFADYVVKFMEEYEKVGAPIWGLTALNEPHGNGENWDMMYWKGEEQGPYVSNNLLPKMEENGFSGMPIFGFDQNKDDHDIEFIDAMLENSAEGDYTGIALHWYKSTYDTYPNILENYHRDYPKMQLLATEATIDNMRGDNAGEGIPGNGPGTPTPHLDLVDDIAPQGDCGWKCQGSDSDPRWNMQYPWYSSDHWWDWWWERVHGSWGINIPEYSQFQPIVEPMYRYGRDIIHSFNHWVTGWVDWNIVLNEQGGPNWAANWCASPITITNSGDVRYNPTFYLFRHFSKYIRPGSYIIDVKTNNNSSTMDNGAQNNISGDDHLEVTAAITPNGEVVVVILNDEDDATDYSVNIAGKSYEGSIQGHAVQTLLIENGTILSSSSEVSSSSVAGASSDVSSNDSSDDSSEESSVGDNESSEGNGSSLGESSQDEESSISGLFTSRKFSANSSMFSRLVQGKNIEFSAKKAGAHTLNIFDITGKKVASLDAVAKNAGTNVTALGNAPLGDGMYFIAAEEK
ncbi:MAG: hypothetical protein OCC49_09795 [Fibrobacterales bacterium]